MKKYGLLLLLLIGRMSATFDTPVHNVVILGSGIAGLVASIYLANAGLAPVVIEGPAYGGLLMKAGPLENFPGRYGTTGSELIEATIEQSKHCGTTFIRDSVVSVDFLHQPFTITTGKGMVLHARSVIVATGSVPRRLECVGEDNYWGNGISVCILCDGPLYAGNKPVVVVGGGDTAAARALFLTKYTNQVTIVHSGKTLSAGAYYRDQVLKNPAIKVIDRSKVIEVQGDGTNMQAVVIQSLDTLATQLLHARGIFVAIGLKPCTSVFKDQLHMNHNGEIIVHEYVHTSIPGVFAAGNATNADFGYGMANAGMGAMAAVFSEAYVTELLGNVSLRHVYCDQQFILK